MKAIEYNSHKIESSDCILNMLWMMDLRLILFNTSYSIVEYIQFWKNQAAQLYVCQQVMKLNLYFVIKIYDISFILGKLSLKKAPLDLGA